MPRGDTEIALVLHDHWLQARVATRGLRLQELLNDQASDYIRLYDVHILRAHGDERELSEAVVRRAQITLAMPLANKHEAPEKRVHSYVNKQAWPTEMLLNDFHVRGFLHSKGASDPVSLLTLQSGTFIPATQATVWRAGPDPKPSRVPLVLVNKERISLLHIAEISAVRV